MPSVPLRKKSWIPGFPASRLRVEALRRVDVCTTEEETGVPNKESGHDGKVSLIRLNYIITIS